MTDERYFDAEIRRLRAVLQRIAGQCGRTDLTAWTKLSTIENWCGEALTPEKRREELTNTNCPECHYWPCKCPS